jgi:prophage regulatory protein
MFDTNARSNAVRLLRIREVIHRSGLSRSAVYRAINQRDFPAPVKLGTKASAWPEHEIEQWCSARIAARDEKGGA